MKQVDGRLIAAVAVATVLLTAEPSSAVDWGALATPTAAPTEVVGSYARGCLGGAVALPLDGPGYEVMRLSRNRYYGHPALVGFIQTLAVTLQAESYPGLLIGDLSQPRGGPMNSGHRSHQSGLDVDIWFLTMPVQPLSPADRETLSAASFVVPGGSGVDGNWSQAQVQALRLAAQAPEVDRIFVNPAIKQDLCDHETGDRAWLRKIRPWWGHDDHFHVRLACPADQTLCEPQPSLPAGDGCDDSLAWWFSAEAAAELAKPKRPSPPLTLDDMPAACRGIYSGG